MTEKKGLKGERTGGRGGGGDRGVRRTQGTRRERVAGAGVIITRVIRALALTFLLVRHLTSHTCKKKLTVIFILRYLTTRPLAPLLISNTETDQLFGVGYGQYGWK